MSKKIVKFAKNLGENDSHKAVPLGAIDMFET